jgi:ADP-glucose pyrophosphorylase
VGKNTEVRDAVILPGVKIGDNSRITRCLIDSADGLPQNVKQQISDGVKIGNAKSQADNKEIGKALGDGYSYVGSGTVIPKGISIGGGCYIAPGLDKASFARVKNITDGRSVVK